MRLPPAINLYVLTSGVRSRALCIAHGGALYQDDTVRCFFVDMDQPVKFAIPPPVMGSASMYCVLVDDDCIAGNVLELVTTLTQAGELVIAFVCASAAHDMGAPLLANTACCLRYAPPEFPDVIHLVSALLKGASEADYVISIDWEDVWSVFGVPGIGYLVSATAMDGPELVDMVGQRVALLPDAMRCAYVHTEGAAATGGLLRDIVRSIRPKLQRGGLIVQSHSKNFAALRALLVLVGQGDTGNSAHH